MSDQHGTSSEQEAGFEIAGMFYPWYVSDHPKDLMLIDRFTGMAPDEFFAVLDDPEGQRRGPVILAMLATSIRARNPEWSVGRVERLVLNTELGDVEFVRATEAESGVAEEGEEEGPPTSGAEVSTTAPTNSTSSPNGSSGSSPQEEDSPSEPLSVTQG